MIVGMVWKSYGQDYNLRTKLSYCKSEVERLEVQLSRYTDLMELQNKEVLILKQNMMRLNDEIAQLKEENGFGFIYEHLEISAEEMKKLAFELKGELKRFVLILTSSVDNKPLITLMISEDLVAEKSWNASAIIRELAKEIKGGGGGQPFFATAGGADAKGLKNVKRKCKEVGALLILDEIQPGIGRTGKMFAFQKYNVEPDILVVRKGLGGGLPIGAFCSSREKMKKFEYRPSLGHISTFGGNPV